MSTALPAPHPAGRKPALRGWRLRAALPKGLYPRSLLIIVTPVILLQVVLAVVFMDRHYESVTRQLSTGLSQEIGAIADLYALGPERMDRAGIEKIARERMRLAVQFLPPGPLPPSVPDIFPLPWSRSTLADELAMQLQRPFSIEPVDGDGLSIHVALDGAVMQVTARRSQAYASNWHIFIVWMFGTAVVLLVIAILFLRNQIRPILRLADAAEAFGKGRDVSDFKPRGAREVRQAAFAFLEMRSRIERQIEQRTAMLAGVSHDLRTILTRFRLQLALLDSSPEHEDLAGDVDEMTRMLEAYLAFARGDAGEQPCRIDVPQMLADLQREVERGGGICAVTFSGEPEITARPDALKRCLLNLLSNAARFGTKIAVAGRRDEERLTIFVDDDGPGIRPEDRELVFRPFLRLDEARNQDHAGTGLGLAIARDIARAHGGEITLTGSSLGGVRATVSIPV